jgi:hypothetical protein
VPPKRSVFSSRSTLRPSLLAVRAVLNPAAPVPNTMRSN